MEEINMGRFREPICTKEPEPKEPEPKEILCTKVDDTINNPQIKFEEAHNTIKFFENENVRLQKKLDKYKSIGTAEEIQRAIGNAKDCLEHALERFDKEDEYDKKDNTELEAYQKFGSPEEVAEMLKITEQSLKRNVVLKRIINAVKDITDMKDLI